MKTDGYRAEFERITGFAPTDEFLGRVEAAEEAGMTEEALMGCLTYEAAAARVIGGVYRDHYGMERGREEACYCVYRRMRKVWKQGKAAP